MQVESREYKMMLDHRMFAKQQEGLRLLEADLMELADRLRLKADGRLDKLVQRKIRFLDTPDGTFRANRLILRHRREQGKSKGSFTLKCRFEDRYAVAAKDLCPSKGLKPESKFEEDIAPLFRSRFSHSVTVSDSKNNLPDSVGKAAKLFPVLGKLPRDGGQCQSKTPLNPVGSIVPHERVFKGLKLSLGGQVKASVAAILWSHDWKQRVVCAELSFRYRSEDEAYPPVATEAAYELFAALQKLEWRGTATPTKTQFVYDRLLNSRY